MREKRKGRKLISRIFAGLICAILVATLLPGLPGGQSNAADFPTTGTGITYSVKVNGSPVTGAVSLESGDYIVLNINIINSGGVNGWESNNLTYDTEYEIPLTSSNIIFTGADLPLTANLEKDGETLTYEYGSLYKNASGKLAVQFKRDVNGKFELKDVIDANIEAQCQLDPDAIKNNKGGVVPINLPGGTTINVTVTDADVKDATDPKITKTPNKNSFPSTELGTDGVITWTIAYTAPTDGNSVDGYTGEHPAKITDKIEDGLIYVSGGDYDSSTKTVTFTLADYTQNQTFTYTTKLDPSTSKTEDFWNTTGNKKTIPNTAKLQKDDGSPVIGIKGTEIPDATKSVDINGPAKPGLSKTGSISADGSSIEWTVTVDTKGTSTTSGYTSFKVIDTLGDALDRPASATVNGADAGTIGGTGRNIEITIPTSVANAGGSVTVKYTTGIKSGVGSTYPISALNNSAKVDWTTATSGVTGSSSNTSATPGNIGSFDFVPIKKSHTGSYDYAKRQFTWDITVGNASSKFSTIELIDQPVAETSGNLTGITHRFIDTLTGMSGTEYLRPDADKVSDEVAFIKTSIEEALAGLSTQVTGATIDITITPGTSASVADTMKIVITPPAGTTIDGPFTFQVHSYSSNKIVYAGNNGGATNHTNQVTMTENTNNNGAPLTSPQTVTDVQTSYVKDVIDKNVVSYNPKDGIVTWKIDLNKNGVALENVMIEDTMTPVGVASFVLADITVGGNTEEMGDGGAITRATLPKATDMYDWTESKVYYEGNKLYFMVKNLNQAATITYQTKLEKDPAGSPFKSLIEVPFKNEAKLVNRNIYSTTGEWHPSNEQSATATAQATIPNNVMSKTSNAGDGQTDNKVKYSIALNPYGMQMNGGNEFTLFDAIDNSIVIDEDSVEVWKGVQQTAPTGSSSTKDHVNIMNFSGADQLTKAASSEDNSDLQVQFDHSKTDANHPDKNVILKMVLQDATPYIIEYEAYVIEAKNGLQNNVDLGAVSYPHKSSNAESVVKFNFASSGYATLSLPKSMLDSQYFSVAIKKLGSNGLALGNVSFNLYEKESDTTPLATGTTDSNGLLNLSVYKDDFSDKKIPEAVYLEETAAPAGHKKLPDKIRIEKSSLGAVAGQPDMVIKNLSTSETYGSILINKVETGTTTPVEGAVFGAYDSDDKLVGQGATDDTGKLEIKGLKAGEKYTIKELSAPTGYEISQEVKDGIEVTAKETPGTGDAIRVENTKTSGSTPPGNSNPTPGPKPPVGPEKPNNGSGGTSSGGGGSTGGGGGGTSGGGGGGTPPLTVPPVTVPGPVLDTTSTTPTPAPTAPSTPEGTPEAPAVTPEGTPVVEGAPAVEGTPEAPAAPASAVTVTFQTELGNVPTPQTMTPGQVAYNPGAPMDPASLKPGMVINGQRFEGWYTDPQFKNAYKFGTPVTEDMVLYAKWTKVGEAGKSPKTADNNWMLMLLGGAMAILAFAGIKVVRIKKRDRFS